MEPLCFLDPDAADAPKLFRKPLRKRASAYPPLANPKRVWPADFTAFTVACRRKAAV
jgi:hypothetical protein